MNGPDNFREAGDILLSDRCSYGCPHTGCAHEMAAIGRAIAHAIQGLTAAVIATGAGRLNPDDRHEWLAAIDPEHAAGQAAPSAQQLGGPA